MPYGRDVVISRLWFLSPYALRLTIHGYRGKPCQQLPRLKI